MNSFLSRAACILIGSLVIFVPASGQTEGHYTEATADVARLVTALKSASATSDKCVKGSCFEVTCEEATALHRALDQAVGHLTVIERALRSQGDTYHKEIDNTLKAAAENDADTESRRKLLAWSQALSDGGKIMLTAASLFDILQELQESGIPDNLEGKDIRQLAQSATELVGLAREFENYYQHVLKGKPEYEAAMEGEEKRLRWMNDLFDLATAASDHSLKLTPEIEALARAGKVAEAQQKIKAQLEAYTKLKSIALIVGRELATVAEDGWPGANVLGQKDMIKDIEANEWQANALNQRYEELYKNFTEGMFRLSAVSQALAQARIVLNKNSVCVRGCQYGGTLPSPDVSGQLPEEILAKFNPLISKDAANITRTEGALSVKPGHKPVIAVGPKKVYSGENVIARYRMGVCKETEGARLDVRNARTYASRSLGDAQRGEQEFLQKFSADRDADDYELRLVDSHGRALASDIFSVLEPSHAGQLPFKGAEFTAAYYKDKSPYVGRVSLSPHYEIADRRFDIVWSALGEDVKKYIRWEHLSGAEENNPEGDFGYLGLRVMRVRVKFDKGPQIEKSKPDINEFATGFDMPPGATRPVLLELDFYVTDTITKTLTWTETEFGH